MSLNDFQKDLIFAAFKPLELNRERHQSFLDMWEEVNFPRNHFITEAGTIERSFYVVESGVQMIYILDQKGEKKVIGFSFNGSFSGVYDSFVKKTSTAYFLESLTESKLLRIGHDDFLSLYTTYPEFEQWGRIVHLELLIGRVNREVELITKSANERFAIFTKRCPPELLQIPQKYLASYLNMTPETYSRLRKIIS